MAEVSNQLLDHIKKSSVVTNETYDNGIAALSSVLKYHGYQTGMEQLRLLSGTNEGGSTLFGLQQAAISVGFGCKGYKIDTETLKQYQFPVILSVVSRSVNQYQDFIVVFGTMVHQGKEKFVVSDAVQGFTYLPPRQLEAYWPTRHCLVIEPPADLAKTPPTTTAHQLLSLFRQESRLLYATIALFFLEAGLLLCTGGYLLKQLADVWLPTKQYAALAIGSIVAVAAFAFLYMASTHRKRLAILWVMPLAKRLNEQFYFAVQRLPKMFFFNSRGSRLLRNQTKLRQVNTSLLVIVNKGIGSVIAVSLIIISVAFLSPLSLLITLPLGMLYFVWLKSFSKKCFFGAQRVFDSQYKSDEAFVEFADTSIRWYNRKRNFKMLGSVRQYHAFNQFHHYSEEGKSGLHLGYAQLFCTVIFIGATCLHAWQMLSLQMSMGLFLALGYLYFCLWHYMVSFFTVAINIHITDNFIQQVSPIEAIAAAEKKRTATVEKIESVTAISVGFAVPGYSKEVFSNMNFAARAGEITVVMGSNGSGKSLMANMLAQHYAPSSGGIAINGTIDLQQVNKDHWMALTALVPQQPLILNESVVDNISMGESMQYLPRLLAFMKTFGLDVLFQSLPRKEYTIVGEGNIPLSFAQMQVINIARAVYGQPALLIIDDALQGLDEPTRELIIAMLKKIKTTTCIILFTADKVLAAQCGDHIFNLTN
jgi:ATP-binding cassette, subfamily C, bacteriocin exporter